MVADNAGQPDSLPSWNDREAKRNIVAFVQSVTDQRGPGYVPPAARIAVFDNDGTLWNEQPLYIQLAFALDRVKALAPEHPEWHTTQPFQAVLEHDQKALTAAGVKGLLLAGRGNARRDDTDEFEHIVKAWFAGAKHPRFKRPYTDLAYQSDGGVTWASARQQLQDLHRLGRRHRVHARWLQSSCTGSRRSR